MTKSKSLTKKQIETLKKKLLQEKEVLLKSNFTLDDLSVGVEGGDEIESAVNDYTSSHLLRFKNRENFYLKKLDKSLIKIDKGDYGDCDECGETIKYERLLARPTAEMCIFCKEEAERDETVNFFGRQSKSHAKSIDFNKLMVAQ